MTLHQPGAGGPIAVTPASAGWEFSGLRVIALAPDEPQTLHTGTSEVFVLPLSGAVTVAMYSDDRLEATIELAGRESVFTGVTDFAYAGRDTELRFVSRRGAEIAVPSAVCTIRRPPAYGAAADVPVEVRGAGPATRRVINFGTPDVWAHAEKLMCCELITPPGNWSSYPPHKHDATDPCGVANEEIYYYRIAGPDQITPGRAGFGLHRTYTGPEHATAGLAALDETFVVRDGDVVLIPHGYHGPCVAAPGYPMYYLNVLAGPGENRSMAFCDDPAHTWVRDSWSAS